MLTGTEKLRAICLEQYFKLKLKIQSDKTQYQYLLALHDFRDHLQREPVVADLEDDRLILFMRWLKDEKKLSPRTINDRSGRIKSLWNWLAKRGKVPTFPTFDSLPIPHRDPQAFTAVELRRLFIAASRSRGSYNGVRASAMWTAWFAWIWTTAERKEASMKLEWSMLDLNRGIASLPAEIRKGKRKPAVYQLWPWTIELLRAIQQPSRKMVFSFGGNDSAYYKRYKNLLEKACLPSNRYSKTHAIRVTHATWLHIAGGDATTALMHSSSEVTRKSYLDPRLLGAGESKLFIPWQSG